MHNRNRQTESYMFTDNKDLSGPKRFLDYVCKKPFDKNHQLRKRTFIRINNGKTVYPSNIQCRENVTKL